MQSESTSDPLKGQAGPRGRYGEMKKKVATPAHGQNRGGDMVALGRLYGMAKGARGNKKGSTVRVLSFFDSCGLGLFVEFLLTQVLDIDGLLSAFPIDDGRFGEFLTVAEFFHDTSFFKFSLEFLESSFDVFAFFNRNYDHFKYLFLVRD